MVSSSGEDFSVWDAQQPSAQEEKIFVSVRVRPLNDKERAKNDVSDWECINNTTIISKNNLHENRSLYPAAYTFDRVFASDCSTKQVYDEGAKRVAHSVLSGINCESHLKSKVHHEYCQLLILSTYGSLQFALAAHVNMTHLYDHTQFDTMANLSPASIFAYGQTSSGKTYTMSGITEQAISDIYDYIEMVLENLERTDREFLLKFSAMEIYNESVRDLLSSDSTPLRLLDDPERGTVVDKLTEVVLEEENHLRELVAFCEAERRIGETALNETSSRSHQILRLTVESSANEFVGADNSSVLAATVNFIDLAGSERASQTASAGTRLKEGSHINRSLLTLGTVIRKLSKGRGGHIPYRDSKLTRILQNYLGGNARTAIICTMSPAHSHVEQSRNTLLFAMCAKDVNTNAQVNVVMSEKALVKQLQRELARLENELKNAGSKNSSTAESTTILKEKELLIQKMDKEIRDLTLQRDLAQSRLESMLQSSSDSQTSSPRTQSMLQSSSDSQTSSPRTQRMLQSSGDSQTSSPWIDVMDAEDEDEDEERRIRRTGEQTKKIDVMDAADEDEEKIRRIGEQTKKVEPTCVPESHQYSIPESVNMVDSPLLSEAFKATHFPNSNIRDPHLLDNPEEHFLSDGISPRLFMNKYFGPDLSQDWEKTPQKTNKESEDNCKEVRCIEVQQQQVKDSSNNTKVNTISASPSPSPTPRKGHKGLGRIRREPYEALKQKIQEIQTTIDCLASPCSSDTDESESKSSNISRSKSCRAIFTSTIPSPTSEKLEESDSSPPNSSPINDVERDFPPRPGGYQAKAFAYNNSPGSSNGSLLRKGSGASVRSFSMDEKELNMVIASLNEVPTSKSKVKVLEAQRMSNGVESEQSSNGVKAEQRSNGVEAEQRSNGVEAEQRSNVVESVRISNVVEADVMSNVVEADRISNVSVDRKSNASADRKSDVSADRKSNTSADRKSNASAHSVKEGGEVVEKEEPNWVIEFEKQRRAIIELWNECNVPLVHRTYFFLLFKGDPSDSVYFEVELRRLSFLKQSMANGTSVKRDGQALTPASRILTLLSGRNDSQRDLNRERDMLARKLYKMFTTREREALYQKWGIKMDSKQRRVQLSRKVWTDTKDMDHINESAALVAKLFGIVNQGEAPKEMFGLSFFSPSPSRAYSWKNSMYLR